MSPPYPFGVSDKSLSNINILKQSIPLSGSLRYDFNPIMFTKGFSIGLQIEATYIMYGYKYTYNGRIAGLNYIPIPGTNKTIYDLYEDGYMRYNVWNVGADIRLPLTIKTKRVDYVIALGGFYNVYYNWKGSSYYTYHSHRDWNDDKIVKTAVSTIDTCPDGVAPMRYGFSALFNADIYLTKSLFVSLGLRARLPLDGTVGFTGSATKGSMEYQLFGTAGIGIKINRKFNPYY